MVVETPVDDDEKESIKIALEEVSSGSVTIDSIRTASESNYDYEVKFTETHPKPKMRTNLALLLYHPDQDDWEVNVEKTGMWLS